MTQNSTPSYKPRGNMFIEHLYTNILNSVMHNSQKVQTTHTSFNWRMDKNVVYPYIKERSTCTCYLMDESWKHHRERNKSDTKHIWLHISLERPRTGKFTEGKL